MTTTTTTETPTDDIGWTPEELALIDSFPDAVDLDEEYSELLMVARLSRDHGVIALAEEVA